MSHPINTLLYEEIMDTVPLAHIKKLQAQGYTETDILERYTSGDLKKQTQLDLEEPHFCPRCNKTTNECTGRDEYLFNSNTIEPFDAR